MARDRREEAAEIADEARRKLRKLLKAEGATGTDEVIRELNGALADASRFFRSKRGDEAWK